MTQTVKIKRSTTQDTPASLAEGELAYSEQSHNLFIGTAGSNEEVIGGSGTFAKKSDVPAASSTTPAMDGSANAGSATTFAKGDHVHPTDTSRAASSDIPAASTTTPSMDGSAAYGSGTTFARSDHVHPSDTSRVATSSIGAANMP